MKQQIYAVKDTVSQEFQPPFFLKNDAVAIKEFGRACENPETLWNQHPSDYVLHNLGEFDTESGTIISTAAKAIATASQFAKEKPVEHISKTTHQKGITTEG